MNSRAIPNTFRSSSSTRAQPFARNSWLTGLASLAYGISGDATYLTPHFEAIMNFPKKTYHAPGDAYDWYGVGPGPIGDNMGMYLCWGNFLYALHRRRSPTSRRRRSRGCRILSAATPAWVVYALEPKDRPFKLTFTASSLGRRSASLQ